MSRTLKIAVVDDEPDMRESISQWLALSGFDTETFASADESIATVDAAGQVTPVAVGDTTVTVTAPNGLTATAAVHA